MRNTVHYLLATILIIGLSCSGVSNKTSKQLSDALESGFVTPPESIQTSVYWYWISDHISREGAVKDLHAMKEAGINRAFIGNIGISDLPYGNTKIFSDEWWEILHLALKTAAELDIEIGIFNSPGWSQSGGPWIKPEESMRYLASSELTVQGPRKIEQSLEKPTESFQDVKVIAFPSVGDVSKVLSHQNASIQSTPSVAGLSKITDGDTSTGISFPNHGEFQITFSTEAPFTARSLTIRITEAPLHARAILEAKLENGEFKPVSEFEINRSNTALNVGFEPYAPVVISLPATSATGFRVTLRNVHPGAGLAEVRLSSIPRVERYSEKTLAKMHPTPLPYWDAYMWSEQPETDEKDLVLKGNDIQDISNHLSSDGVLTWDVPEGEWTILRMGMAPTLVTNGPASPEATGLEVDKMSRKWVAEHFDRFIGEILRKIPEADRKTFKVVVQDSYETGGQNFTDDFLIEFKERYGYDPLPYLPVYNGFVINSQLESDRFLWDMRRMVADKVAYDYVGGLRDVSHEHGLTTWLENYGHWGFPGEFLMYGGQSDEIGGEFWSQGELGDIENRAASSAGHIYGKTKISAESNTSGGPAYSRYPAMMKQRTDRFFAEGINNTLLHVYIMQPYEDKNPGMNAWFGNEFDRKNTWFPQLDLFTTYLKRSNFMLQQGLNVADVAYFIGEDAPKMTGVADPPLPVGYQFDYMNAEVILRDMEVKDGMLTLPHGTQYKVLVLPQQETMRPEVLAKIKKLVGDGATVLGPPPTHSPSLQNQPEADEQVRQIAAELWGGVDGINTTYGQYGKGRIINGLTMEETFGIINCIPDCKLPEDNNIHYGHRTLKGIDIYFLSNQTNEEKEIYPEFRVTNRQPELWDATNGSIRVLPAYEQRKESTLVPIKLAPYESTFVVFRNRASSGSLTAISDNYPEPVVLEALGGPWQVTFDASRRGPAEPVIFETLQDWTTFSDDRIKYYSGEATYTIQFTLPEKQEGETILIDLGNLTAMAKVTVNGTYAGGAWTPPYRLDITEQVKTGENELNITVVNNWMNRIIGDLNLPEAQRETWYLVNPHNAQSPLQPSGLFGPVTLHKVHY
ncbi:glycosyl hydrolase [uncultured Proteiniphilum sp.]|uniref:glycosyl hydrolase n=1 Tax=uncultured Proteiniphilum sp. TaxID=497637 RepID=UPI0026217E95|nr:glycosyl hydrolase [uncultured Proteiniphilum sp.]